MNNEKLVNIIEEAKILNLDLLEFLMIELSKVDNINVDFTSVFPKIAVKLRVMSSEATSLLLMHLYILVFDYINKYVMTDPEIKENIDLVGIFSLIGKDVKNLESTLNDIGPGESDKIN
jgi:hypothetical protein